MVNNQIEFNNNFSNKEIKEIEIKRNRNFQGELIIEDYSELERLELRDVKKVAKVILKNLSKLQEFTIWNCNTDDLVIENCPNLKTLNLRQNYLTNSAFLTNLDNLEKLELDGNIELSELIELLKKYQGNWKICRDILALQKENQDLKESKKNLKKAIQEKVVGPLDSELAEINKRIKRNSSFFQPGSTDELTAVAGQVVNKLKGINESLKDELSEVKNEIQMLEEKLTEAEKKLVASQEELEAQQLALQTLEKKLRETPADNQLREKVAKYKKKVKELEQEERTLQIELAGAKAKLEIKEEEVNHLKDSNIITKNLKLLDKVIGQGAFGKVYLGKYHNDEVAVKKLDISFNSSRNDLMAIKDELDLLSKLKHANIINFLGFEQKDSHLYLVMEYANQGSLTDYIKNNQDKDHNWKLNYQFISGMTQGLAYLHNKKIVHRDLKSMNILINNNIAKLADFGLSKAKTFKTRANQANQVGTVRWMAPEILTENKPHTFASDIYSLGMIFWEMVSKCTIPFKNDEERFIANNYCRGEREAIPNDAPPVLKVIINGCWAEQPEQRISLTELENKLNGREESSEVENKEKDSFVINAWNNSEAVQTQSTNFDSLKLMSANQIVNINQKQQRIKELEEQIITKEGELEQLIISTKNKLASKHIISSQKNKRTQERHGFLNQFINTGVVDSKLTSIIQQKKVDLQEIINLQNSIKNLQEQLNDLQLEAWIVQK